MAFNILCAAALMASYVASRVSPADFWPVAFVGLAFPVLYVINFSFLIYWLLRRRWYFMIPLLSLGLGWGKLGRTIRFFPAEITPSEKGVKVMSYNVRLFDLYNWTDNVETRDEIFKLLVDEDADIICMQEFFYTSDEDYNFNTLDTLTEILRANQVHTLYTAHVKEKHHFGIATFSVYPIVNRGEVALDSAGNNRCIYSDILKDADTIRVYNMHLASVHLSTEDYKFLEDVENKNGEERIKGGRQILWRLKRAFQKRARQADQIHEHIEKSPHPVIVCGDFNDSPVSYTYASLVRGLKDAFHYGERGMGWTYIGSFPYRIDYVLFDKYFSASEFRTIKVGLSDHYPVAVVLSPKTEPSLSGNGQNSKEEAGNKQ